MPEKFMLNENTKPKVCDARRCGKPSTVFYESGEKLCERHAGMVTESDGLVIRDGGAPEPKEEKNSVMAEIIPVQKEAQEQVTQLKDLEIFDDEMAALAAQLLDDIAEKAKEFEKKKKKATAPLNASLKEIRSWFKPAEEAFEEGTKIIKSKLMAYREVCEAERMAALASGNTARALSIRPPSVPDNLREVRTWTYQVEDIHQVPRHLMVVDHEAIKELIRDNDPEKLEIPGIRIFQQTSLARKGGPK